MSRMLVLAYVLYMIAAICGTVGFVTKSKPLCIIGGAAFVAALTMSLSMMD
jgi:hypothetical protein